MNLQNKMTYLNAWFSQVNAQPIGITTVVIYEFLQRSESCPSGNEESTFIQLTYAVVFDGVPVTNRQ